MEGAAGAYMDVFTAFLEKVTGVLERSPFRSIHDAKPVPRLL